MDTCLFCRIVEGEIPASIVHADDDTVAFGDISPQAPTHVLVVPRRHAATAAELCSLDPGLAARWLAAATRVAEAADPEGAGYRLVVNTGPDGGQTVDHAHIHVLVGRALQWPPG